MKISCPVCSRTGSLPERFRSGVHAVKCRRCESRFWTSADRAETGVRALAGRASAGPASPGDSGLSEWASDLDDDSAEIELGSSDSHYELPIAAANELDFDDGQANRAPVRSWAHGLTREQWKALAVRFATIWRRVQLQGALALGGVAFLVIGVMLASGRWAGEGAGSTTALLIVGLAGTIGFAWLSLSMAALFLSLDELSRTLNRLEPDRRGSPDGRTDREERPATAGGNEASADAWASQASARV